MIKVTDAIRSHAAKWKGYVCKGDGDTSPLRSSFPSCSFLALIQSLLKFFLTFFLLNFLSFVFYFDYFCLLPNEEKVFFPFSSVISQPFNEVFFFHFIISSLIEKKRVKLIANIRKFNKNNLNKRKTFVDCLFNCLHFSPLNYLRNYY